MNLDRIKCFVDIVKFNSFTVAAQENYITQATISQQIASMEAELGFSLFERNKRGFTLTEPGKSFYESSLRLLALYSRSLSRAKCIANNLSGFISLGVWPGFDVSHIYKTIGELTQIHPSMQIVMRPGTPAELRHKYKVGRLAMAIGMPYDFSNNVVSDAVIEPLATCGYRLWVSISHTLARRESVCLEDIRNEKFAVLGEECIGFQTYSRIVIEQMQNHHNLTPTFVVQDFETQQMLVATNQAVMFLPELCRPGNTDMLKPLRVVDYPETCVFAAIWRSNQASPLLLTYADSVKGYFKKNFGG